MWKEIKKGTKQFRGASTAFRVRRGACGGTQAHLLLPPKDGGGYGARARVFASGDSLGFAFGEDGGYVVSEASRGSRSFAVAIPRRFVKRIPFGTTEAKVSRDGGMFVLDLSQFGETAASAAAE